MCRVLLVAVLAAAALPASAQVPVSAIWQEVEMGLGVDLSAPTEADSLLMVAALKADESFKQLDSLIQTQALGWERVARHNVTLAAVKASLGSAVSAAIAASASEPGTCRDVQYQMVRFGVLAANVELTGVEYDLRDVASGGEEVRAVMEQLVELREAIDSAKVAWRRDPPNRAE